MAGIGLGAHAAFTNARKHVGAAAFCATAIPAAWFSYASFREPVAKNEHNRWSQGGVQGILQIVAVVPYLLPVVVSSKTGIRICYWIGGVATTIVSPIYVGVYMWAHRERPKAVRAAVNVESLVERYQILGLIVLGESLMALLFEGSDLLAVDGVQVSPLFRSVFQGVLIVYSIQTLYFNVDNASVKGDVHAIRHNRWFGLAWTQLHFPYFMALAGFLSTGIGLMLRAIALPFEKEEKAGSAARNAAPILRFVVRAAKLAPDSSHFDGKARWLFSGAWMSVILISCLMGWMHKAGPRGQTKNRRIMIRVVMALGLGLGMPFADVTASKNLAIFTGVSCAFAFGEVILMEMDRIGMLSRTGKPIPGSTIAGYSYGSEDTDDNFSVDSDLDSVDEPGVPRADAERDAGRDEIDRKTAGVRREAHRRAREHRRRFDAVSQPDLAIRDAALHHAY